MNRNQIIEEIYNDRQYIDYCFKVCQGEDLHQDLFQYVVLYLLEMPKGKLEAIHERGEIRMYVARIIYINVNSKSSQFYKQYKLDCQDQSFEYLLSVDTYQNSKEENGDWIVCENGRRLHLNEKKLIEEKVEPDKRIEKINKEINKEVLFCHQKNVYPASVKLLEIYSQLGSFQAVHKATGIPYKTVRRHIQGLTEKIKASI